MTGSGGAIVEKDDIITNISSAEEDCKHAECADFWHLSQTIQYCERNFIY
jgi:hypothetical protein